MPDDPPDPREERTARRADLHELVEEQQDATWERGGRSGPVGVGMDALTGDLGPKGAVAAQLRATTRRQRRAGREVPFGTAVPGTGRYIFAFVAATVLVGLGIVVLLGWATS